MHYHVVREYVGQLMKNNYSCKNRKHEKAATKIHHQWDVLTDVFDNMVTMVCFPINHKQWLSAWKNRKKKIFLSQ